MNWLPTLTALISTTFDTSRYSLEPDPARKQDHGSS
jgi:hypothetical protein